MLTDDRCQCVLRTQPVEFPVFISPSPARSFPPLFVLALFPSLLSGEASIASNSSQSQTSSLINGRGSRLPSSPVLIAAIKSPLLPTNTRATYYPSAVSSFPPHTTGWWLIKPWLWGWNWSLFVSHEGFRGFRWLFVINHRGALKFSHEFNIFIFFSAAISFFLFLFFFADYLHFQIRNQTARMLQPHAQNGQLPSLL